jgi:hypothetical protein
VFIYTVKTKKQFVGSNHGQNHKNTNSHTKENKTIRNQITAKEIPQATPPKRERKINKKKKFKKTTKNKSITKNKLPVSHYANSGSIPDQPTL